MPEIYECAGFLFEVTRDATGKVSLEARPDQHPAAYKEKHRRAALEMYNEERKTL